jgi:hypothetical protein
MVFELPTKFLAPDADVAKLVLGAKTATFQKPKKLDQGFSSVDRLEEVDIRDGIMQWPTYINAGLPEDQKEKVRCLV